jgi:hypothetical protein
MIARVIPTQFRRYLLVLVGCCLLVQPSLMAQEKGVLRGLVIEYGSQTRVSSATILNLQTQLRAATDARGEFTIPITVGDHLVISKLGYRTDTIQIKTLSDILIDLSLQSVLLDAVTVYGESKEQRLNEVLDGYRRQGVYFEGQPPLLAYFFQPLSAFYALLSKDGQRMRNFQKVMATELQAVEVDRKFRPDLIRELTPLDGKDLENFTFFYRPSYQTIQYWTDYDLIHYIRTSFKKFDADGRPAPPALTAVDSLQHLPVYP